MLTEERYNFILEKLNQYGVIKSQELMVELDCSESTIRRDIASLEEHGKLVRVHGGAKRVYMIEQEQSLTEKSVKNIRSKEKIAELAASLVEDGDTIFLDAGSTTFFMVPFLKEKNIRIVTNAVQHALLLADLKDIFVFDFYSQMFNTLSDINYSKHRNLSAFLNCSIYLLITLHF